MILSIIFFLIIICTLILVHELGHYFVARKMGILASAFFVGFGPTLFSFKKWGTEFSVKLFPLGGACVFDDKPEALEDELPYEKTIPEGSIYFLDAGVWQRIAVVVAGPLCNFIMAFFLCLIIIGNSYCDRPVIQDTIEGFPAMEAGMKAGDEIISVNGERIYLGRELSLLLSLNNGQQMDFVYRRDGEKHKVSLMPQKDEETGRLLYGFRGHSEYFKANPLQVIQYSFYELRFNVVSTIKGFVMLFSGKAKADEVTGIVGMAAVVDDVTQQSLPYGIGITIINLLSITAILSVNLGVLNLFPIPALDGGRLLFYIIELIRGRAIPPEKEGVVHLVGFVIIAVLGILVIFNDIAKLFRGGF